MEHIAPLIQTVLWVGLIGVVVWRFHAPIYGLLTAFQKRVEGGSNIKAGPFEITEQLKPQDPSAQKQKAEVEAQEALAEQSVDGLPPVPQREPSGAIQARHFQAEDLVLRAMQAELGVPVSRQVTAGKDDGFDGLLIANGRATVIEVKYVAGKRSAPRFRPAIQRLTKAIQQYGWTNAQIILALVFEREEDVGYAAEILSSGFSGNPVPVVVRVFTLRQLEAQFGVDIGNEG